MGTGSEINRSTLGPGSKMMHFGYLGDTTVGEHVNVAVETARKHRIVYASNHRSHTDYLVEPLVLDDAGIRPPIIAAGINLFGGPLGLVRTGDRIELSVDRRQLNLLVEPKELEARRKQSAAPRPRPERGYERLYVDHVQQAHLGCDFDFLTGTERTPEPEIH